MRRPIALTLTLLAASSAASAQTVANVAARGQCSTAGVVGVSRQLVDTQLCMFPGAFVNAAPHAGINLSDSRLFTLAQAATRDALWAAARTTPLTINSMFRTLADQYVLYHSGACGLAATPGTSNHETGTAVDLANWSAAMRAMTSAGCSHPYPGRDDVHYDCPGGDRRADSIRAFQRLWNVNNAGDRIAEDGAYGPMTAARVARSPAGGFGRNGCADPPPTTPAYAAAPVTVSCPREATSGERPVAYVEYRNTGTATWDTTNTRLGTTGPRDHRGTFFDATNWVSASRPSTVDHATASGAVGRFSFVLAIPEVATDTTVSETYGLLQEAVTWFGPADDAVRCAVMVHPRARDAGMADVGNGDVGMADVGMADVGMADVGNGDVGMADVSSGDVGMADVGNDDAGPSDAGPIEEGYVREGGDGGDADPMGDLDGGCQCHTGAGTKPSGSALALAIGALVLGWRRRRRR
jgi:MYXO-CTERM domain-containing protein